MKFSQRLGITPVSKKIQIDNIDQELKNGLWNVYYIDILSPMLGYDNFYLKEYSIDLWSNHLKLAIDSMPNSANAIPASIKKYFETCKWYEIYDFIEYNFNLTNFKQLDYPIDYKNAIEHFNIVLKREFSGYQLVGNKICPITNKSEVEEIEKSLMNTEEFSQLKGANIHLSEALNKLSDRINPDYRNSIKESISAIESVAKIISNGSKDSLGGALDKIKGKIKIHSSLEKGFKQIYGYTSDGDGIRHSLSEESNCDFEDAKFMLVSSSAFINYLIAKCNKAGVNLNGL